MEAFAFGYTLYSLVEFVLLESGWLCWQVLIRFMAAGDESRVETSSSSSFKYSKSTGSLKRFCVREEPCGAVEGGADGEKSCQIICIYMCV